MFSFNAILGMSSFSVLLFGLSAFCLTMGCGLYFNIPVLTPIAQGINNFLSGLFQKFIPAPAPVGNIPTPSQPKANSAKPSTPKSGTPAASPAPAKPNKIVRFSVPSSTQPSVAPSAFETGRLNRWMPTQTTYNPISRKNEFLSPADQAVNMLKNIVPLLNTGKKVALTYSANYDQFKGVKEAYANGQYIISGSNQAQVFEFLTRFIYANKLQDRIHILPVVTMEHGGNTGTLTQKMVIDGLENVAAHIHDDWVCLGLSTKNGFSIGGGVNPNFKPGGEPLGNYTHEVLNQFAVGDFTQGYSAAEIDEKPATQKPANSHKKKP